MSYDTWKTTNPADAELGPAPTDECAVCGGPVWPDDDKCRDCGAPMSPEDNRLRECDSCGEYKTGVVDTVTMGMDVSACPRCRYQEEDPDADRGDWRFHRDCDQ